MKKIRLSGPWLFFLLGGATLAGLPWIYIRLKTQPRIFRSPQDAPSAPVAIVFGAGLYRDGTPLPVLADRVAAAVDLYKSGKVGKLLLTGDNRFPEYNEPEAMRQYAISLGVPEADLVRDFAGRRTYDSCYRARFVFNVRQAILVSQDFHLPRALYLCDNLGIDAVGVAADRYEYRTTSLLLWNLREWAACAAAIVDAQVTHPQPVLGPLEPLIPDSPLSLHTPAAPASPASRGPARGQSPEDGDGG
ncbi:MAG: YdcF family protein [Anaerolineales bacterium]|nr:YdcF family protein [Anaerolineales bacterium]